MAKQIDKQKTYKEAERIKKALLTSRKPALGLDDNDVKLKQDEDGYVEIHIDVGTVEYEENIGAHPKNVSKVIDADYNEYRRKGWTFTQPSGGRFSIGVPAEKINEGYTFAQYLSESVE